MNLDWRPVTGSANAAVGVGTIPEHPEWSVRAEVVALDGRLVVQRVEVQPEHQTPRDGLTSTVLSAISIPAVLVDAQRSLAELLAIVDDLTGIPGQVAPGLRQVRARNRGRPGERNESFALLAWLYLDEIKRRGERGARGRVAEILGWSPSTLVRDRIAQATDKGLISPGRAGSGAGRYLTEVGRELALDGHLTRTQVIRTLRRRWKDTP